MCVCVFFCVCLCVCAKCPGIVTVNHDLADWTTTREVISKLGHFDLLVNNAAVLANEPFLDATKENVDRYFPVDNSCRFHKDKKIEYHAMCTKQNTQHSSMYIVLHTCYFDIHLLTIKRNIVVKPNSH